MTKSADKDVSKLLEIRFYSSANFDKQIVYINSGALLISIGFIERIIDVRTGQCKGLLIISWTLFIIYLICNLYSHTQSIKAVDKRIMSEYINSENYDKWTICLNNISLTALALGLVFFIIYISINL